MTTKITTKKIKLDNKTKIRFTKTLHFKHLHINIGRYAKGKKVSDTWTLYDSIVEKHKPYATIWADYQGSKLIGLEVTWE